jgi:hypothetical protein
MMIDFDYLAAVSVLPVSGLIVALLVWWMTRDDRAHR